MNLTDNMSSNCTGNHNLFKQAADRLAKTVHEMLLKKPGQSDLRSLTQDEVQQLLRVGSRATQQFRLAQPSSHDSPSHQANLACRTSAQRH